MKKLLILCAVSLSAVMGCSLESVDPGHVGVEVTQGHVTGTLYGEGTHSVSIRTELHPLSIRLTNMDEEDIPCRSSDNVSIRVDVTVSYALTRSAAAQVYKKLGDDYAQLVILPAARSSVRDAVAGVEALQAAQSRSELEEAVTRQIRASIRATLDSQGLPQNAVRIDTVQLRNVELPETLTASIESIQQQRNQGLEREQALRTAQQEAERLRIVAEGAARVAIATAQQQAEVRRINGESEAQYNRTVSASLTPALMELRRIDAQRAIAANPNAQLVVFGGGGGGGAQALLQVPQLGAR